MRTRNHATQKGSRSDTLTNVDSRAADAADAPRAITESRESAIGGTVVSWSLTRSGKAYAP